jgi:hypothetical protein
LIEARLGYLKRRPDICSPAGKAEATIRIGSTVRLLLRGAPLKAQAKEKGPARSPFQSNSVDRSEDEIVRAEAGSRNSIQVDREIIDAIDRDDVAGEDEVGEADVEGRQIDQVQINDKVVDNIMAAAFDEYERVKVETTVQQVIADAVGSAGPALVNLQFANG